MAAANAVTASTGTAFETTITGFERLSLGAVAASGTVNLANIDDLNDVAVAGVDAGQALTLSGAQSGINLRFADALQTSTIVTLANNGSADVANVFLTTADNASALALLNLTGFETINIASADTDTDNTAASNALTALTAAAATSIVVTGNAGFALANGFAGTALTTLDASGITAGGFTYDSAALAAAATIKGSAAGTNTVDVSDALGIVTYTGGTGADVIASTNNLNNVFTLGNGANSINAGGAIGNGNNTVTAGTGGDTIKLGNGNNIIDVGAGTNTVEVGNGNNTITGGTGADTITVGTGSNTIVVGGGTSANSVTVGAAAGLNTITTTSTGVDTLVLGAPQTAAGFYISLTGWAAGDRIDFHANTVTVGSLIDGALGAKITLGSVSTFANYLDVATASTQGGAANLPPAVGPEVNWFTFGSNTYIVVDNSNSPVFDNGVDTVLELVGTYALSTATLVNEVLTFA